MTNKFNVGDKVRFVEKFGSYQIGDKVKVTHTDHLFGNEYTHFIGEHGTGNCYSSRLELIHAKPTENQRIANLEEEVAELRSIVKQISEVFKGATN